MNGTSVDQTAGRDRRWRRPRHSLAVDRVELRDAAVDDAEVRQHGLQVVEQGGRVEADRPLRHRHRPTRRRRAPAPAGRQAPCRGVSAARRRGCAWPTPSPPQPRYWRNSTAVLRGDHDARALAGLDGRCGLESELAPPRRDHSLETAVDRIRDRDRPGRAAWCDPPRRRRPAGKPAPRSSPPAGAPPSVTRTGGGTKSSKRAGSTDHMLGAVLRSDVVADLDLVERRHSSPPSSRHQQAVVRACR